MKHLIHIISVLLIISGINCGADEEKGLYLSGKIEVDTGKDSISGPAFVAVATTDDFDKLQENMADYLAEMVSVDLEDYTFIIDLTGTDLKPGDKISIFGFIDNDFTNGIPDLSVGDYMGFYFN